MKSVFEKITRFFKKEWFLLVMVLAIAVIIFLFEMFIGI